MKGRVGLAIMVMAVMKHSQLLLEFPEVLLYNNINMIIRFYSCGRSFTAASVKTSDMTTFAG
jgi:hypothetical protein